MKSIKLAAIAALLFLIGCSASQNNYVNYSRDELSDSINRIFSDTSFSNAHWGVLIKSLKTGDIWYQENADKMFMPASNEKIATAASALVNLGPDFEFETYLCYSGQIIDSTLTGDLIIFGGGDPTFYTRFFDDPHDVMFNWAERLKSIGIKNVSGSIIGDDNAFDDNPIGYGWAYDGLKWWYSAEVGALQFNENYIDITIKPPKNINDTIAVEPNVKSSYFKIVNNLVVTDTGKQKINLSKKFGTNKFELTGNIRAGGRDIELSPAITNPTRFFVNVFKEVLDSSGINVNGDAEDCDDIEGWQHIPQDFNIITITRSPKLSEVLKMMMKKSQNLYAETMVRMIGWKNSGLGSFENGKEVVVKTLEQMGVKPGSYRYMDGSGLSRYNYFSPRQFVNILEWMYNSNYGSIWEQMLPVAGVDGTLEHRMISGRAENNVHAKTGTISNVRALSGYVTTSDGEKLEFSFLVNGHLKSAKDTEAITDSVLELLAEFPRINKNIVTR